MFTVRRSPFLRAAVTPITLATFLSACSSWATLKEPVAVSIAEQQPQQVRVTTANEGVVMLNSPTVEADTLTGILPGTRPEFGTASYALVGVASVEVWQPSTRGESNWIPTELGLADLCAEQVTQVRLTLTDGRKVVLGSPQIEGDRVGGTALDQGYFPRTAIALADVTRVEKYKGDSTGVVVIVVLGAVALAILAVVATQNMFESIGFQE